MAIDYRTATEARDAGQLDAWRESRRTLEEARKVIRESIRKHFDGWTLPRETLAEVLQQVDAERVALVLAATLAWINHDGRISRSNHTWAASVNLPEYMRPDATGAAFFILDTHPAVLDGFVSMFRRWQAEQK